MAGGGHSGDTGASGLGRAVTGKSLKTGHVRRSYNVSNTKKKKKTKKTSKKFKFRTGNQKYREGV
tara:strand:- start:440 stop:634 length:195 start_codon:yes stop_codon:yes gene_type:complete